MRKIPTSMTGMSIVALVLVAVVFYGYAWSSRTTKISKEKTRLIDGNYVKVTVLSCGKINELYPKSKMVLSSVDPVTSDKNLEKVYLKFLTNLTTCSQIDKDFQIRYSLIRYKKIRYESRLSFGDKNTMSIKEINVPYCVIGTDISEIAIAEICDLIP